MRAELLPQDLEAADNYCDLNGPEIGAAPRTANPKSWRHAAHVPDPLSSHLCLQPTFCRIDFQSLPKEKPRHLGRLCILDNPSEKMDAPWTDIEESLSLQPTTGRAVALSAPHHPRYRASHCPKVHTRMPCHGFSRTVRDLPGSFSIRQRLRTPFCASHKILPSLVTVSTSPQPTIRPKSYT